MSNSKIPFDFLSENRKNFMCMRNSLSSIFKDISEFISRLNSEIRDFRSFAGPCISYYYPGADDNSAENFISEVVEPCNREIINAIGDVLSILNDGNRISLDISGKVGEILEFGPVVNRIIRVCDDSARLLSSRQAQGAAQAYQEIIDQAAVMNNEYRFMAEEFEYYHSECVKINEWISQVHGQYLLKIRSLFESSYSKIIERMKASSCRISQIMEQYRRVEDTFARIITGLQFEDIERQNIEKVAFLMELICENHEKLADALITEGGSIQLDEALLFLIRDKTESISNSFKNFLEEFEDSLSDVYSMLNIFSPLYNTEKPGREDSIMDLAVTYSDYMELEIDFIRHVKKISEMKKNLYMLINNITRKRSHVKQLLNSGKYVHELMRGLAGISEEAPDSSISPIVQELGRELEILGSFVSSNDTDFDELVNAYYNKYHEQEKKLHEMVFSQRKVSLKFDESIHYNSEVKKEIKEKSEEILGFLKEESERVACLRVSASDMSVFLDGLNERLKSLGLVPDMRPESYSREIPIIRKIIEDQGLGRDYRGMMVLSLLAEYSEPGAERVMFF